MDDTGTSSLEFITTGLLLLVPLVYLVLAVSTVQGGSLAVEGASRQAARVFVEADSEENARTRALTAVQFALADYGIDMSSARVAIECTPNPADCLARNGRVAITVRTSVALPLVPPVLVVNQPLGIALDSTATQTVSRFRPDQ